MQSAITAAVLSTLPSMAFAATANNGGQAEPVGETLLLWLDGKAPARFEGATLGVPWPRGAMRSTTRTTWCFGTRRGKRRRGVPKRT